MGSSFVCFIARVANPNWSLGRIGVKISKISTFEPHFDENKGNHPKCRKIIDFRFEFGPQKILFGPRVGHPCFIELSIIIVNQ
jgi:hypothetical protein